MKVRDILKKCVGNTYVYIYDDDNTYVNKECCKELRLKMRNVNDNIYDKEVLKWHISDGEVMIEV